MPGWTMPIRTTDNANIITLETIFFLLENNKDNNAVPTSATATKFLHHARAKIDIIKNTIYLTLNLRARFIIAHREVVAKSMVMGSFRFWVDHNIKEGQNAEKKEAIIATFLLNNLLAIRKIRTIFKLPARELIKNRAIGFFPVIK